MSVRKDHQVVQRLLQHPSLQGALSDPAAFFEVLQATCHCLEENDVRDQADRLLGMLIAQQASHLISTAWPVLFQQLRDTTNVTVKLCIIRHFSNICSRLGPAERKSAFHIFSEEADKLFADVQVVTDHSFVRNLDTIIKVCARHADRAFCVNLFTTILNRIHTWDRKDALRACCEIACLFPIYSDSCGSVEDNLHYAEDTFPIDKYALLLECTTRALFDYRDNLGRAATSAQWLFTLRAHTRRLLHKALFAEPPIAAAIPPAAASYARLRNHLTSAPTHSSRASSTQSQLTAKNTSVEEEEEEQAIVRRTLQLLGQGTLKRLVVPPLLNLLSSAKLSANQIDTTLLWTLAQQDDPFVRSAAMDLVAKIVAESPSPHVECGTTELSLDHLHHVLDNFAQERCTYTVNALIHLFIAHLSHGGSGGEEDAHGHSTFDVVESVVEKFFRFHEQLRNNASVQIEILSFIDAAPVVSPAMLRFVIHTFCCVETEAVLVRAQKCMKAILYLVPLNSSLLDVAVLTRSDVFESVSRDTDWIPVEKTFMDAAQVAHNLCVICALLKAELLSAAENEVARDKKVKRVAENACFFADEYSAHFHTCDKRVKAAFVDIAQCIEDLLFGDENFPVDILSALLHTLVAYLNAISNASGSEPIVTFFVFERLFARTWNMLHRCCAYLDPSATPQLHSIENVLFGFEELSFNMERVIAAASEVALTNAKKYRGSSLCEFIHGTTELFALCIRQAAAFPLFTDNLLYLHPLLIGCLHALMAFDPKAVMRIFGSLTEMGVQSSLMWYTDLPETSRRRNELMRAARDVLLSCLTFDLQESIVEAVNSLCRPAQDEGIHSAVVFTRFFSDFDPDHSVFQFFKSVALCPQFYTPVYGTGIVEPALRLIAVVLECNNSVKATDLFSSDNLDTVTQLVSAFTEQDQDALGRCVGHLGTITVCVNRCCTADEVPRGAVCITTVEAHFVALLDNEEDADSFFEAMESLCDFSERASTDTREQLIETVLQKSTLRRLACAAALDPRYTENAVRVYGMQQHGNRQAYMKDFLAVLTSCTDSSTAISVDSYAPLSTVCDSPHVCFAQADETSELRCDNPCSRAVNDSASAADVLVSAAALPLPFPYVSATENSDALISALRHNNMTAAEYWEWCFHTHCCATTAVTSLCRRNLLFCLDKRAVVQLARCLSGRCDAKEPSLSPDNAEKLMERLWAVVSDNAAKHVALFRHSVVVLLSWLLPSLREETATAVSATLAGSHAPAKNDVIDIFFLLVKACLGVPASTRNAGLAEIIADFMVQIVTGTFDGAESVVLGLCQLFRERLCVVIIEEYEEVDPLRLLALLTKMVQIDAVTPTALREINARLTPLLLPAFRGDGDQEVQNANLLLTAVALLKFSAEAPRSGVNGNLPHAGFSHWWSNHECPVVKRKAPRDALAATYCVRSRVCEPASAESESCPWKRVSNHHTWGAVPSLFKAPGGNLTRGKQTASEDDELLHSTFLHVYVRSVTQALQHLSDLSPFGVTSVFSTLSFLLGYNALGDKTAGSLSAKSELRDALQVWVAMQFSISPWLAENACQNGDGLRPHIGPFPDSYRPLPFYDTQALLAASSLICSRPSTTTEADIGTTRGATPLLRHCDVTRKMLETDLVTYIFFLLSAPSAATLNTASAQTPKNPSALESTPGDSKHVEATVATILTQRLGRDVTTASRAGPLGLSFCVRALLHATVRATVATRDKDDPPEKVLCLTKLTEAAFNDALWKSERALTVYYANYVLQCVLLTSKRGEPQWETIRILLTAELDAASTTQTGSANEGTGVDTCSPELTTTLCKCHGYQSYPTIAAGSALSETFGEIRRQHTQKAGFCSQYDGEWRTLASLSSVLMLATCAEPPRTVAPTPDARTSDTRTKQNTSSAIMEKVRLYAMCGQWTSCAYFCASRIVTSSRLDAESILELALQHANFSPRSRMRLTHSLAHLARCLAPARQATATSAQPVILTDTSGATSEFERDRDAMVAAKLTHLVKVLAPQASANPTHRAWIVCVVLAALMTCTPSASHQSSPCILKMLAHFTGQEFLLAQMFNLHVARAVDSTRRIGELLLSVLGECLERADSAFTPTLQHLVEELHRTQA